MSLLQIKNDPVHEHDASSDGEDLAKGSSYLLWTTIIAFVVVSVSIAAFLLANKKPPVAAGEVVQIWAHSVHTLSTPRDANGVSGPTEQFDQVLVFSSIRVRNQSDQPIVIKDLFTNATFDDGPHESYAAGAIDYDRVFIAYPELAGLHGKPLLRETIIAPGQVADGMMVSSFKVTQKQWAARKDVSITVALKFHPDLVLLPKGPITEQ
jgi:hypothetical protein